PPCAIIVPGRGGHPEEQLPLLVGKHISHLVVPGEEGHEFVHRQPLEEVTHHFSGAGQIVCAEVCVHCLLQLVVIRGFQRQHFFAGCHRLVRLSDVDLCRDEVGQ